MEKRKFPASQAEALRQKATYYFTGKPCKRGHVCERFAKNRTCKECAYERNRERTSDDYWIDYGDEAYKKKKRQNASKYYHTRAHKRAIKLRRHFESKSRVVTPRGVEEIKRIYLEARILTIDSGVKHEVDHIIPLIHDQVCGLSVPVNCQILTKDQNRRKASRFNQDEQSKIQMQLIKKPPKKGATR